MVFFTFNSSARSSNIRYSYSHHFIFILHGFITNRLNDQLPVGSLAQLVTALHRYRRDQGFEFLTRLSFFRLLFATAKVASITVACCRLRDSGERALRVSTNTPNKRESYFLVNFALFNSRHGEILF